ncbi:hypothetical protein TYRP_010387 [Tyrophagus putrescentiae]|nr:hypothetical protein TYRP_010387 [Tyrophagus putrescentiae]
MPFHCTLGERHNVPHDIRFRLRGAQKQQQQQISTDLPLMVLAGLGKNCSSTRVKCVQQKSAAYHSSYKIAITIADLKLLKLKLKRFLAAAPH